MANRPQLQPLLPSDHLRTFYRDLCQNLGLIIRVFALTAEPWMAWEDHIFSAGLTPSPSFISYNSSFTNPSDHLHHSNHHSLKSSFDRYLKSHPMIIHHYSQNLLPDHPYHANCSNPYHYFLYFLVSVTSFGVYLGLG